MTSAIASDGNYLYIHNSKGLHKIGSGYAGTVRAHIYSHNPNFHPKDHGWLAYAQVCCLLHFRITFIVI